MNRWFLSFLFSLSLSISIFSESVAELSLMHQRNPRNKTILYYLASGHLKDFEFKKSLHYFTKLKRLDSNFQNLYAGIAHSLYGLGKHYESFEVCRGNQSRIGCEKFLQFLEDKHSEQIELYQFLYELRIEKMFDVKQAGRLLEKGPLEVELIASIGDYFLRQNLSEIAFDVFRLAPEVYSQRALYFRRMVRDLRRQFRAIKFEGRDQEKLFYLSYYIWKFAPEFGEDISSPNLIELMDFFKSKLSDRTSEQFENYYRLAYLQALDGLKLQALKTLELALDKSPNKVFSFVLSNTVKRQLKLKKAVKIVAKDLSKIDASKESYIRWRKAVNDPEFRESKKDYDSSSLVKISNMNGFFLPTDRVEYQSLITKLEKPVLLEFCNPSRDNCKRAMKDVYTNPQLVNVLSKFQKIRVDPETELGRHLRKQFPLRIQPQIYCLNSNLEIQGEFSGLTDVQKLKSKLSGLVR